MKKKSSKFFTKAVALGSALTVLSSVTACTKAKTESSNNSSTNKTNQTKFENGERKPNVIYVVLDDIGFSDLGSYGSEIKTPNIDQLAASGLRYNNFNACPFSSATRASLLTGRESNSVGMGHVANVSYGPDRPDVQGRVTDKAGTIAQMLKDVGYSTMGLGKWHIAPVDSVTPAGPYDYWPLAKGFEKYYGFMDGETDQYKPQLVNGNEVVETPKDANYNLNDDLLAHAKKYITEQASVYPNKPFFMNYAFGTGHSPIQVPDSYINAYNGVYDKGWDAIRQERFNKQKELGIIPSDAVLTPSDSTVPSWDSLSADQKKLYARFMQAYAGYLTQADEEVGKLIDYLKETGQYDNTMIVLLGDNGATGAGGPDGIDTFIAAVTGKKASFDKLLAEYNQIGGPDVQAVYPKGWGQVSNTPFSHYKASVYQGALRNPLIISWPKGITDKGGIRNQYVHVTDITPTVLDLLKVEVPKTIDGVEQMTMYGTSIVSTFDKANTAEVRDTAISTSPQPPSGAIYNKGWKAVFTHKIGNSYDDDKWELYHVSEDYSESTNVSDKYPDKLKELKELFKSEAKKSNITLEYPDQAYVSPDSAAYGTHFKYYPGVSSVNTLGSPLVGNTSFTITVPVTRENTSTSGVLVALGDNFGGYSMYIKDNKLNFTYRNYDKVLKLTSNIDVPIGKSELKFEFKRTAKDNGVGTLYINGQDAGKFEGDILNPSKITMGCFDIGRDTLGKVSDDYKELGDFDFTGKFDYVQYDLTPFKEESK